MAYAIFDNCLLAEDIVAPIDDRPYGAFGTEYRFRLKDDVTFFGRMGYNSRTAGSVDGFTGAGFGAGILLGKIAMDYSFLPFGGLGSVHRVSLSSWF